MTVDIHSSILVLYTPEGAVSPSVLASRLPGDPLVKPIRCTQVRFELRSGKCGLGDTVGTGVFYSNIRGLVASCVDAGPSTVAVLPVCYPQRAPLVATSWSQQVQG